MKIGNFRSRSYLLVGILVVAAILRFTHITQPFSDIFSWRQSSTAMIADNFYRKNWNIFYPEVNWTGPGPGYQGREFQTISYIAALLYVLVGQHDWVGRCVAVMFSLWGIFALYQLVRRVWDEERAIASAAVMTVLPGSIFIERSFLPDPVMVSLVTTSFWMLVAYLQTSLLHYLLLAGLIGTWGFLTKIPGLIVGIPMVYATLAILGRRRMLHPKKIATMPIVAIFTLVPVLAYYLWARHLALSYPPYHFAGSGNWLWDNENYFLPGLSNHHNIWLLKEWLWPPPVLVLFLFGLIFHPPREERGKKSVHDQLQVNGSGKAPWLFHWWLFGGVVYYFIGAEKLVNNLWNFHIINPATAALAGHALVSIKSFTTRIARSSGSLVIIVAIVFMISVGQKSLSYMYKPYANEDYKLGLALHQTSQTDDLVVTIATELGDPVAIYYSHRRGWSFPYLLGDDNEAIRMFEEYRANGGDWLGIVNVRKDEFWNYYPTFVKHIKRTCEFKQISPEWVVYQILTPEEVAKLPAQT